MQTTTITTITIIAYLLTLLIIGYKENKGKENFLIGNRELKTTESTASLFSYQLGAGYFLFVGTLVYFIGFSVIWYPIGQILGYLILYKFIRKIKSESTKNKYYTLSDYFKHNHNRKLTTLITINSLLISFIFYTASLIGSSIILSALTNINYLHTLIISYITITLYLLMGGYRAVSKTDIIQFFSIIIVIIFLFLTTTNSQQTINQNYNLFTNNLIDTISWLIFGIFTPFALMPIWQRIYSAKNTKVAKRSILLNMFSIVTIGIIIILIALNISTTFPNLDPSLAFIEGTLNLISNSTPILVILFLAAALSSADTDLFSTSLIFNKDLINTKNTKKLKLSIVVFSTIGLCCAYFFQNLANLYYLLMALIAPIGIITLISLTINHKTNSNILFYSLLITIITTLTLTKIIPGNQLILYSSIEVITLIIIFKIIKKIYCNLTDSKFSGV